MFQTTSLTLMCQNDKKVNKLQINPANNYAPQKQNQSPYQSSQMNA